LREDSTRTDQVFELNVALDGGDSEGLFQAFLMESEGADLLLQGGELTTELADFDRLGALPAGTLGARYLQLMQSGNYAADGLSDEAGKIDEYGELYPGEARGWFARRQACIHDLLHVVSGYGQDVAGETALLAFTYGLFGRRLRQRVIRIGMLASVLTAPGGCRMKAAGFSFDAYRRGRHAHIPLSFAWEKALERSLDEVRRDLRISPLETHHPEGVLVGDNDAPWQFDGVIRSPHASSHRATVARN